MLEENQLPQSTPIPPVDPRPVYIPSKPKFPILPALIGFFIVVIVAALMGVVYFKTMFKPAPSVAPTPTPIPTVASSPSASPSATSSPIASAKSSAKPTAKPTPKPTTTTSTTSPTPTPTPVAIPTLDIRFGNPSAIVKQTFDDGSGDGRVINREYSSIQVGEFDELSTSSSPKVTVCYNIVSNEEVKGQDVKLKFTLDDKSAVEDTLAQYDKLEAGRLYSWCHDTTNDIGRHTAKLSLNDTKSLKEVVPGNNFASIDWVNLSDKIAPNISIGGPFDWDNKGTCFIVYPPSDNVNKVSEIKVEQRVDALDWSPVVDGTYCFTGTSGSAHTYKVHAIDARGNVNEQTKTFVLY